jgi:thiamine-phosphate pyrophosphorylase
MKKVTSANSPKAEERTHNEAQNANLHQFSFFGGVRRGLIVITSPHSLPYETELITSLFNSGLEILHLRKPDANKEKYERLLSSIPEKFHNNIVLHEYFELADAYNIKGIHLNKRNPDFHGNKKIAISKSCHSLDELQKIDLFEYVFLSPVFNSISKKGYSSGFTHQELLDASNSGLINEKVIALGGIDASSIPVLKMYSFGGIALLGTIWETALPAFSEREALESVTQRFMEIKKLSTN